MATSSIFKTFYIDSEKEADTFAKLLSGSLNSSSKSRKTIKTSDKLPKDKWDLFVKNTLGINNKNAHN